MILDLFSGAGGWDVGARMAGLPDPIGVELDAKACATREANGLPTMQADVTDLDPEDFSGVEGLIASPPCPDFSVASVAAVGRGVGRDGETGRLIDEPLRWVHALQPEWIACEQVPPALDVWKEHAIRYRSEGYNVWTGVLSAERYGVPQTRRRAVLLASRTRWPQPPEPTHEGYTYGEVDPPSTLFAVPRWRSMADALGWTHPGWWQTRPATTIAGDPRCFAPGGHVAHDGRDNSNMIGRSDEATVLTAAEAATLQSFPDDFEWSGSRRAQHYQIGNAVPPLLAQRILEAVTHE